MSCNYMNTVEACTMHMQIIRQLIIMMAAVHSISSTVTFCN